MADAKLTDLTEATSAAGTDLLYLVSDPGGSPTSQKVTVANAVAGNVAPTDAQYVTLATNATLSQERVLTAGTQMSFADGGAGSTLTLNVSAGPVDAQYLTLATNATLTGERVLTPGTMLSGADGGAGSTYTLNANINGLTGDDPVLADLFPFHDASGGDINKATLGYLLGQGGFIPGGRLTLTTGVPVTTSDVTAAGTLYYTPYLHNRIRIFDGTRWQYYTFSELSLALTLTSGKPYDIWIYDNAGTLTLEALVWTNDTTRATALTTQDGVYVKTGATTRLYLGTIYASGANTTEDSFAKRYVFNMYNRVPRAMRVLEATNSWTYNSATYQQANATSTNQLDLMVGVADVLVNARTITMVTLTNNTGYQSGIGYDSATTPTSTGLRAQQYITVVGVSQNTLTYSELVHYPAVGRHFYTWLEATFNSVTIYGDNGGTDFQSGIQGITQA